jgi:hypothetical protein
VKEQYYAFPCDTEPFTAILGEELVGDYFRQAFELKVKGDRLPTESAGDPENPDKTKADMLVERVKALFAEFGCSDALESKECIVPVENFKTLRLTNLSLEQSLALERVGDKGLTQCSVSTKGTRSK